jgi:predicted ATPase
MPLKAPPLAAGIFTVLNMAVGVHRLPGEIQNVHEQTEALLTLASEQGFPAFLARGTLSRGWILAMQGQAEAGTALVRQVLTAQSQTVEETGHLTLLIQAAQVYGAGGQPEAGLRVLDEALALVSRTGVRHHEAEVYRLKGELLLHAEGGLQQAAWPPEACFQKALEVARRQQARSYELRAAISLSRLWQQQNKRREAYDLLAPVYNWFTEGFDTADLQEAKALLDALQ